jgi:hypothetical protein
MSPGPLAAPAAMDELTAVPGRAGRLRLVHATVYAGTRRSRPPGMR